MQIASSDVQHGEWWGAITWPAATERYAVYTQGMTTGGEVVPNISDCLITLIALTGNVVWDCKADSITITLSTAADSIALKTKVIPWIATD